MEKILLQTKQDYIDYCTNNSIANFPRKYGSTWMTISHGKEQRTYLGIDNGYVEEEPLSYPCIFTYFEDYDGNFYGDFIYPYDFN